MVKSFPCKYDQGCYSPKCHTHGSAVQKKKLEQAALNATKRKEREDSFPKYMHKFTKKSVPHPAKKFTTKNVPNKVPAKKFTTKHVPNKVPAKKFTTKHVPNKVPAKKKKPDRKPDQTPKRNEAAIGPLAYDQRAPEHPFDLLAPKTALGMAQIRALPITTAEFVQNCQCNPWFENKVRHLSFQEFLDQMFNGQINVSRDLVIAKQAVYHLLTHG